MEEKRVYIVITNPALKNDLSKRLDRIDIQAEFLGSFQAFFTAFKSQIPGVIVIQDTNDSINSRKILAVLNKLPKGERSKIITIGKGGKAQRDLLVGAGLNEYIAEPVSALKVQASIQTFLKSITEEKDAKGGEDLGSKIKTEEENLNEIVKIIPGGEANDDKKIFKVVKGASSIEADLAPSGVVKGAWLSLPS